MSTPDADSASKRRGVWIGFFIALGAALLFLVVSVPTLDVNKRQRANEASTVSRLRRLSEFQKGYAATNPRHGFACQLSELKLTAPVEDTHDRNEFLATSEQTGYKFVLTGCQKNPAGVVVQYQVIAVPIAPGQTGFRAFCSNQDGVIWYDPDPAAKRCLTSRRPIE